MTNKPKLPTFPLTFEERVKKMKPAELRAECLRLRRQLDRLEPLADAIATIATAISDRLEAPQMEVYQR